MPSSSSSSSSGEHRRYITLRVKQNRAYVDGRTQGYRLNLEVEKASGVAPEIFVFQRRPNPVSGGVPIDDFVRVASPFDLDQYAIGQPAAGQNYYRLSSANLVFRNLELLEQSLGDIENDVQELIQTLNQLVNWVCNEAQTHELT